MAGELIIRPLRPDDDRSTFTCGNEALDRFFREYAGQNQFKLNLSVSHVAVVGTQLVGFATVAAATIERASMPKSKKRWPAYPLPVLRLARLAVDVEAQHLGVGRELLAFVLGLAKRQRELAGCVGVLADAKREAVGFYAKYGFEPLGDELSVRLGARDDAPLPLFLPIDSIP